MEILLVHPKDENQLAAIKAFMHALNIDFEEQDDNFPLKILNGVNESRQEAKEGKLEAYHGIREMLR